MNFKSNVNFYLVGGAVRDALIRKIHGDKTTVAKDLDFVVENSSVEEMESNGFTCINTRFPVFKHPDSDYEFALCRRELKIGKGHGGFKCETEGVTIIEDLERRDLTINAIACPVPYDLKIVGDVHSYIADHTGLIDPFGGVRDIETLKIRPVSEFFSEDPVRLLRAGRFLARFKSLGFTPTPKLFAECAYIVKSGELENISGNRYRAEFIKLDNASEMVEYFNFLIKFDFGYVKPFRDLLKTEERNAHHPEDNVYIHTMMALKLIKDFNELTAMGILTHDFGKSITYEKYNNGHGHESEGVPVISQWCMRYGAPKHVREFCETVSYKHTTIHSCLGRNGTFISSSKLADLLLTRNVVTNVSYLVDVCQADARGRGKTQQEIKKFKEAEYPQGDFVINAVKELSNINKRDYFLHVDDFSHANERYMKDAVSVLDRVRNSAKEVFVKRLDSFTDVLEHVLLDAYSYSDTTAIIKFMSQTGYINGSANDINVLRNVMIRHNLKYKDLESVLMTHLPFYSKEIKTLLQDIK